MTLPFNYFIRGLPLKKLFVNGTINTSKLLYFNRQIVKSFSTQNLNDINERILNVLKTFEKIDTTKLSMDCNLTRDLGLDSLDVVEAVIAIEEEFGIEIPDRVADAIKTPSDAAAFIKEELSRTRIS